MVATSSSSPVSIPSPASEPVAIVNERPISLKKEEGRCGASALSAALGELRVGSLPIQHESSSHFIGSASLPQPKAPFLSSREGPRDKLLSMPEVTLPESAASKGGSLSSVQYGSLRESKFSRSLYDYDAQSVRNTSHFCQRSLPTYSQNRVIGAYQSARSNLPLTSSLLGETVVFEHVCSSPKSHVGGITEDCTGFGDEDFTRRDHMFYCFDRNDVTIGCNGTPSSYLPPLSSSLTALDVLTRTSEPHTTGRRGTEVLDPLGKTLSNDNEVSQQRNKNLSSRGISKNDEHEHANPDTYEAFDFELEG